MNRLKLVVVVTAVLMGAGAFADDGLDVNGVNPYWADMTTFRYRQAD